MKREPVNVVKELEKLFDELAHNYAINTSLDRETNFERYIIQRIYFCLYLDSMEHDG